MSDLPGVTIEGLPGSLASQVSDRAQVALGAMGMGAELERLVICADDLNDGDETWLQPDRSGLRPLRTMTIYCHPGVFLVQRPEPDSGRPPGAVWESAPAAPRDRTPEAGDFSRGHADVFLHHHLLTVRDLLRRELVPPQVPGSLAEAFAAAWAIGVDGRLSRLDLPGYPLDERRRRFSRLFSQAGILMPEHWRIFQDLWDGGTAQQREVVKLIRRLPRL